MAFDYFTIRSLVEEFRSQLIGRQITDSLRTGEHDLQLVVGADLALVISCSPHLFRIFLARPSSEPEEETKGWQLRRLQGASVSKVEQAGADRIIHIGLVKWDRIGTAESSLLIVELTGRNSNVILIDEETGLILDSLRRVTPDMSRFRQILPGIKYVPPPSQDRICPAEDSFDRFKERLRQEVQSTVVEALARTLIGASEPIAREIAFRSRIPPQTKVGELDDGMLINLWGGASSLYKWFDPSERNAFLILDDRSLPVDFSSLDLGWVPSASKVRISSISAAIEHLFSRKAALERMTQLKSQLSRSLDRTISTVQGRLDRLNQQLDEARAAGRFKEIGDLLMANLDWIRKGQEEARLPDLYRPDGAQITIQLDPELSPVENARRYFRKYQKLKRAKRVIEQRLAQEQARLQRLMEFQERLDIEAEYEALIKLKDELISQGYLREQVGRPKGVEKVEGINPRQYITSDGWTVLVGRNDRENDILSLKAAAPDDLWFHARGCPGSHVVLRREGRKDAPSRVALEEAAALAAYWSKSRGSNTVPVSYTLAKYVTKPRKARPGEVLIRREKTLFVTPRLIGNSKG